MVLSSGKKKEKLIETYEGLPVIGEGVVVEVDEDGEISGMTTASALSARQNALLFSSVSVSVCVSV